MKLTMKYFASIMILVSTLNCYAQSEDYPVPNIKKRKKCISSQLKVTVSKGFFHTFHTADNTPSDTVYFCQIDSIRVTYYRNSILRPIIENGILNGKFLNKANVSSIKYEDIILFRDNTIKFVKSNGAIEDWGGDYFICGGETEIKKMKKNNIRVFSLSCINYGGTKSIFYLELKNKSATKRTPMKEFMKGAYVSCLVKWFIEI